MDGQDGGATKRERFTEERIAFALRRAEAGTSVEEVRRELGVGGPAFNRWRKRFAGMGVPEVRGLEQPEEENRRPKRLVADPTLDETTPQDVVRREW